MYKKYYTHSEQGDMGEASKLLEIMAAEKKEWEIRSIYKLPAHVTGLNKNAYKPGAISFGPYHHGEANLKTMEAHKHRALFRFLNRSGKSMDDCIGRLQPYAHDFMNAYDSLDPKWEEDPKAFLELMIRDGCFMLEILRWYYKDYGEFSDQYAENDPIFSDHGKLSAVPYIRRDMLKLENQLPMLLLTSLLSVEDPEAQVDLNRLIVHFFFFSFQYERLNPSWKDELKKCKHVLDVYRKILILGDYDDHGVSYPPGTPRDDGEYVILPSVTELDEAGILIRRSKTNNIKDISFKNGILSLPQILVDETTEPVFLNLIAFERFQVGIGNEVASYIAFMDIIHDEKDVRLLLDRDVLHHTLGSDKAVARLLRSLTKDIMLDPQGRLSYVGREVNHYSQRIWNQWRRNLIHTYFTDPWIPLLRIAGFIVITLALVQTIYTIAQYYKQGQ